MPEQFVDITEPASIRHYTSGGKGGFGSSTSQLHRLTRRQGNGDYTACGTFIRADQKISVNDGTPKPALVRKYGLCEKCWTA